MIDNLVFLFVFVLVPFFCWKAIKQDDEELAKRELNNQSKKLNRDTFNRSVKK